jgi:hypothetical protein
MTIQWSDDTEPRRPEREPATVWGTEAGIGMRIQPGALPSARKPRDVLLILGLIGVLVLLFVLLWMFGPLPRIFPLMP